MTDEEVEVPNEEESANYKVSFHMEESTSPAVYPRRRIGV
jgi:hypothetical protein